MAYNLGVVCGVLVGLLFALAIVFIFAKKVNTNGKAKTEYDERQKQVRGEGYKYGFWAAIIYLFVLVVLDLLFSSLPFDLGVLAFTGILVAAIVDIIYCVIHDGYWGLNNDKKRYKWFLLALGLLNLIPALNSIIRHGDIEYGSSIINLECGIFLVLIFIIVVVKDISDKSVDEDEEE